MQKTEYWIRPQAVETEHESSGGERASSNPETKPGGLNGESPHSIATVRCRRNIVLVRSWIGDPCVGRAISRTSSRRPRRTSTRHIPADASVLLAPAQIIVDGGRHHQR